VFRLTPYPACKTLVEKHALDLINRQKAEIEHIKQMYEAAVAGQETLQKCYHNYGQGEWIPLEPEIGLFACSLCDHRILRAECNFCPECGAKMIGAKYEQKDT
jgi:hypothetical protein